MIRIVIDTNIALAGFLSYQTDESKILGYVYNKKISLIGSNDTLREFEKELNNNKRFAAVAKDFMFSVEKLLSTYKNIARIIEIDEELNETHYCQEDPDDDVFIRAAIAGFAKVIVTRDKHLLKLNNKIENIRIIHPTVFLKVITKLEEF